MARRFKTEKQLRKALRGRYGDRLVWIEHAPGGTFGMPDCLFFPDDSEKVIAIELKGPGEWLRASQKKVCNLFSSRSVPFMVLQPAQPSKDNDLLRLSCFFDGGQSFTVFRGLDKLDDSVARLLRPLNHT